VCGEDLICAGMTLWGDGLCNPKWMWGYFYGPTPTGIPDGGQVTVPLVVSALASVEVDVVLYVDITHPDPSQLTLTMMNPMTPEGEISQWVVVWDQEATTGPNLVLHEAVIGFSGDEVANGEWSLIVEDHAAGSTGTINTVWTEMTSRWD
jgi:subtilisin-like proprotein convertase family protein